MEYRCIRWIKMDVYMVDFENHCRMKKLSVL